MTTTPTPSDTAGRVLERVFDLFHRLHENQDHTRIDLVRALEGFATQSPEVWYDADGIAGDADELLTSVAQCLELMRGRLSPPELMTLRALRALLDGDHDRARRLLGPSEEVLKAESRAEPAVQAGPIAASFLSVAQQIRDEYDRGERSGQITSHEVAELFDLIAAQVIARRQKEARRASDSIRDDGELYVGQARAVGKVHSVDRPDPVDMIKEVTNALVGKSYPAVDVEA